VTDKKYSSEDDRSVRQGSGRARRPAVDGVSRAYQVSEMWPESDLIEGLSLASDEFVHVLVSAQSSRARSGVNGRAEILADGPVH
jgi:hypothetical protein